MQSSASGQSICRSSHVCFDQLPVARHHIKNLVFQSTAAACTPGAMCRTPLHADTGSEVPNTTNGRAHNKNSTPTTDKNLPHPIQHLDVEMLGSGIAMWQICCRIVMSSSVGGVRIAGVRSRCPCSGVLPITTATCTKLHCTLVLTVPPRTPSLPVLGQWLPVDSIGISLMYRVDCGIAQSYTCLISALSSGSNPEPAVNLSPGICSILGPRPIYFPSLFVLSSPLSHGLITW